MVKNMVTRRVCVAMLCVAMLMVSGCGRKVVVKELNVVPEPVFMVQKEGGYTLHSSPRLSVTGLGQNSATVKYAMKSLRHARMHPKLVPASEPSDISLVLYDTVNPEIGDEGYLLEVRQSGIKLSANTEVGILYGYQTLVQMLPADLSSVVYKAITLPECTVLDYPRFGWRGVHLDVSRHFFPVKFVKKYLDVMAMYKMNRFHFHLTDDQGWRLPSESYPRLNRVGSWRMEPDSSEYGGFYTKEELLEIVDYAAERGIEVVPEIELPGHASAILAAYPQLACDEKHYVVEGNPYWPPKAILCAGNDSTLVLLKAVLDEVCEIFTSKYIHLGGDEAVKDKWRTCPKCQQRIRQEHLRNEEELQAWLMGELARYLKGKGKIVVGWDEVFQEEANEGRGVGDHLLGEEAVVMSWRGLQGGLDAARNGRRVVMCPTEFCYLDYYQADARYQPKAIGGMITLKKAYEFDPAPMGTNLHVEANILGGQCNLWTEYIKTPQYAEYMLLPRMLAVSEALWCRRDRRDWNRFRRKVELQKERLYVKGYSYCEGNFTPQFTARRVDDHTMNIAISTEVPNTYIFYTTDMSTPTRESAIYLGPMNLERGTHIKILPVYKDIERDSVYEFVIK